MVVDLGDVEEATAGLLAAATDVSAQTRASYERRWRMWEAFADRHGVRALGASPEHVAAFVVARHEAGVSAGGIAANLSAVSWFHGRLGVGDADVAGSAREVLRALGRGGEPAAVRPAPILSVGALAAMAEAMPTVGLGFAAKVARVALPGVPPRQLMAVRAGDLRWGPDGGCVELVLPPVERRGAHRAVGAGVAWVAADAGWVACPVRALRQLCLAAGDGPLLSRKLAFAAKLASFNPTSSPDGVPARLAVRNSAIVAVGYSGALRMEELARARVEHLEPLRGGYRLRVPVAKTTRWVADQAVVLEGRADVLDPVAALDRWLAVRGDGDGPLFCALHHRAPGRRVGGEHMPAGDIRAVIGDLAGRVGLAAAVSGYSLRRSWATHRYLEDANDIGRVSLQLRHSSVDMTVRYVEDLRVGLLDAEAVLCPEVVMAGPGGQPAGRKGLGFSPTPLADLVERAAGLARPQRQHATRSRRTYDSHWSLWSAFAAEHGLAALPAAAEGVALFIASRADAGLTPHYLRAQLATIEHRHTEAGHSAEGLGALAREVLDAYERTATAAARKAPLVSVGDLVAMARHARDAGTADALRARLLVCVGYGGAMRPDDLRRAHLEDIERTPWGLLLRLRARRDTPPGGGADTVVLLRRDDELDPVSAVDTFVAATGRAAGPLLVGLKGSGRLSSPRITDRLRSLARDAGVRVVPGGDSLRRSWAAHAYEAGVDLVTIQRHLRHDHTRITKAYLGALSAWADNPAALLARAGWAH